MRILMLFKRFSFLNFVCAWCVCACVCVSVLDYKQNTVVNLDLDTLSWRDLWDVSVEEEVSSWHINSEVTREIKETAAVFRWHLKVWD